MWDLFNIQKSCRCFDKKNPDGCFHSKVNENCWIIIDLKTLANVSSMGLKISSKEKCSVLQGFYLLGSNDGLEWKNISHFRGPFGWVNNEWMNFSIKPSIFKYFQIYQDPSINDGIQHHFHLSSLELYGEFLHGKSFVDQTRIIPSFFSLNNIISTLFIILF